MACVYHLTEQYVKRNRSPVMHDMNRIQTKAILLQYLKFFPLSYRVYIPEFAYVKRNMMQWFHCT